MGNKTKIGWLIQPEDHDYIAASSYLSLIFGEDEVKNIVNKLRKANVESFKSKDIFRASTLSLLGISNKHVEKDIRKIENGEDLSPILLLRNSENIKVIIADGYHRLCAVYSIDEDAEIPCKIV